MIVEEPLPETLLRAASVARPAGLRGRPWPERWSRVRSVDWSRDALTADCPCVLHLAVRLERLTIAWFGAGALRDGFRLPVWLGQCTCLSGYWACNIGRAIARTPAIARPEWLLRCDPAIEAAGGVATFVAGLDPSCPAALVEC